MDQTKKQDPVLVVLDRIERRQEAGERRERFFLMVLQHLLEHAHDQSVDPEMLRQLRAAVGDLKVSSNALDSAVKKQQ